MKKLIALLLVLAMTACLFVGCGDKSANETTDTTAAADQQAEQPDTDETTTPEETEETEETASDFDQVTANGKVVVGITDFEPMDYKDENGEWTGFDAELARAVFGKLGLNDVEFIEIDWDNKIFELEGGNIDCVWNGMTLTDEVLNSMECSQPYVVNAQVVVVNKDKAAADMTAESIADLSFAVEAGSAGEKVTANNGYANVTSVLSQADALMEVAAGTADACIIDLTMANAMTGEGTSYPDLVQVLEMDREEYGIGFRKGSDMAQKVNEVLDSMKADGSLQELADKYQLTLCD